MSLFRPELLFPEQIADELHIRGASKEGRVLVLVRRLNDILNRGVNPKDSYLSGLDFARELEVVNTYIQQLRQQFKDDKLNPVLGVTNQIVARAEQTLRRLIYARDFSTNDELAENFAQSEFDLRVFLDEVKKFVAVSESIVTSQNVVSSVWQAISQPNTYVTAAVSGLNSTAVSSSPILDSSCPPPTSVSYSSNQPRLSAIAHSTQWLPPSSNSYLAATSVPDYSNWFALDRPLPGNNLSSTTSQYLSTNEVPRQNLNFTLPVSSQNAPLWNPLINSSFSLFSNNRALSQSQVPVNPVHSLFHVDMFW